MHTNRFAARHLMVVAQQMQNTVDEQRLDFFTERVASVLCLASGCFY
jgi:hypothetical protein